MSYVDTLPRIVFINFKSNYSPELIRAKCASFRMFERNFQECLKGMMHSKGFHETHASHLDSSGCCIKPPSLINLYYQLASGSGKEVVMKDRGLMNLPVIVSTCSMGSVLVLKQLAVNFNHIMCE